MQFGIAASVVNLVYEIIRTSGSYIKFSAAIIREYKIYRGENCYVMSISAYLSHAVPRML